MYKDVIIMPVTRSTRHVCPCYYVKLLLVLYSILCLLDIIKLDNTLFY